MPTQTQQKTRLQIQEKVVGSGPPKYRGLFQTMFVIVREEGVARLYRGLLPRLLRVPPGMVRAICSGGGRAKACDRLMH